MIFSLCEKPVGSVSIDDAIYSCLNLLADVWTLGASYTVTTGTMIESLAEDTFMLLGLVRTLNAGPKLIFPAA